jgi:hypothetical protein
MAGQRAESIVAGLLRSRGLKIDDYPVSAANTAEGDSLLSFDGPADRAHARQWAVDAGYDFALTGSIAEWRYKSGLDGAPAVGLTLRVVRLSDGATVWSATGAGTGWGQDSLAGTGQRVAADLLTSLTVKP